MTREEIVELLNLPEETLFLDPEEFDACIVGAVERFGMEQGVLLYDRERVIEVIRGDEGTLEEAEEFYGFNTLGAWVGDGTPAFVTWLKKRA